MPTGLPESEALPRRAFYWLCWGILNAGFTLIYRLRVHHAERIPRRGGVLVAANHQSHLDPPAIGMASKARPLHFLAREGLFKSRLFGWLISALNAVPISEDESDIAAIRAILARLDSGAPVLVFPEGSRTPDGEVHEFQRGIALLLKRAKCAVVPIAIEGAFDAFPRHRRLPRLFGQRISIMVGQPIASEELLRHGPDGALARLKDEIESMRASLRRLHMLPAAAPPLKRSVT